jgi:hypothetical protein
MTIFLIHPPSHDLNSGRGVRFGVAGSVRQSPNGRSMQGSAAVTARGTMVRSSRECHASV